MQRSAGLGMSPFFKLALIVNNKIIIVHQEGTTIEVARLPISPAQRLPTPHRQQLADLSFFRTC